MLCYYHIAMYMVNDEVRQLGSYADSVYGNCQYCDPRVVDQHGRSAVGSTSNWVYESLKRQ